MAYDSIGKIALPLKEITCWQTILPAGSFKNSAGQPQDVPAKVWYVNHSVAASIISDIGSRINKRVIDYDYQTHLSILNGLPAPAAGWFSPLIRWQEHEGVQIYPEWTVKGHQAISKKEYGYLGVVFHYSTITGHVSGLSSVSLVSNPGLNIIQPTVQLKSVAPLAKAFPQLSKGEKDVIEKYRLSDMQYIAMRESYCKREKRCWDSLLALTS